MSYHGGLQEPMLLTLGDIGFSQHWVVTPHGTAPLRGAVIIGVDRSSTSRGIPAYAIVLAIVFFFACLLGLLFLLIKEERTTGYFEVSVRAGQVFHVTQLPVSAAAQVAHLRLGVAHAQALAASA